MAPVAVIITTTGTTRDDNVNKLTSSWLSVFSWVCNTSREMWAEFALLFVTFYRWRISPIFFKVTSLAQNELRMDEELYASIHGGDNGLRHPCNKPCTKPVRTVRMEPHRTIRAIMSRMYIEKIFTAASEMWPPSLFAGRWVKPKLPPGSWPNILYIHICLSGFQHICQVIQYEYTVIKTCAATSCDYICFMQW